MVLCASKCNTFYLISDEEAPRAVTTHKNHPTKVTFLVARPRYDGAQCMMFDAKMAMWHVVETKLASRNSKNRSKGTPVSTRIERTKYVYEHMLTQHVIPAIKRLWPRKGRS
jgi:hypothetical protein